MAKFQRRNPIWIRSQMGWVINIWNELSLILAF